MTAKYAVLCDNAVQAAFEKSCRLIRLIWSPLLPFVYSIVSIRSMWICVHLLHRDYSEHDLNAQSPDFERSDQWFKLKMAEENGCVSPADETTTCFIGRWRNLKYSTHYYFSLFWLHNQLELVSLCFVYHDDDDVSVLHDFIRFHYQYPLFLQHYRSSLKTGPARPEISHTKDNNTSSHSAILIRSFCRSFIESDIYDLG